MATKKIDYNARNFADVRQQLISFIKQYYPETFSDFNDASVGMMLLELNAAVGDMLSFHTDRMFNETQINYAQERGSLLELARTFGLNVPGKRPSITVVEWSANNIPVKGDTFDIEYAPRLVKGTQATGGGKIFELLGDCDFVMEVLAGADEKYDRRYRLKSLGYDISRVERKVIALCNIQKENLYSGSRKKAISEARSLFCYWCVRELGESMTGMAKLLGLTQPAIGYAVERGELLAKKDKYDLLG